MNTRTAFESLLPAFGTVRRDLERALNRMGANGSTCSGLSPLSLWHDDRHVYIAADVPGCSLADLELQFDDGKLWIRGDRKSPQVEYGFNERRYGKFERAVLVPEMIDPSSIDATLEDGVLTIVLAKKQEAQPQPIQIKHRASSLPVPGDGTAEASN